MPHTTMTLRTFGVALIASIAVMLVLLIGNAFAQDVAQPINRLKATLKAGKSAIGALAVMPTASSVEILTTTGLDWLLIDSEHGPMDIETVHAMVRATAGTNVTPIVRVPWNIDWLAKRAMDVGAMGILMPMVSSKEDAVKAVRAVRYPPEGERGFGPFYAASRWGLSLTDYANVANAEMLAMVLIEHIDAVNQIDDILSVKGVDAAFIGPYDLSGSMGMLGQVNDPKVQGAIDRVLAAGKRANIPVGILATTPEDINKRLAQGFQLILIGTDTMLMSAGTRGILNQIKR